MGIVWSKHARQRQKEWYRQRGITWEDVEAVVRAPEQVATGHAGLLVAQSHLDGGLLRVPFVEVEGRRKIVTLYWTSQLERYWED